MTFGLLGSPLADFSGPFFAAARTLIYLLFRHGFSRPRGVTVKQYSQSNQSFINAVPSDFDDCDGKQTERNQWIP